jgi:hypothetical protein
VHPVHRSERERERKRKTDRQKEREGERERDRQKERERGTERERVRELHASRKWGRALSVAHSVSMRDYYINAYFQSGESGSVENRAPYKRNVYVKVHLNESRKYLPGIPETATAFSSVNS